MCWVWQERETCRLAGWLHSERTCNIAREISSARLFGVLLFMQREMFLLGGLAAENVAGIGNKSDTHQNRNPRRPCVQQNTSKHLVLPIFPRAALTLVDAELACPRKIVSRWRRSVDEGTPKSPTGLSSPVLSLLPRPPCLACLLACPLLL